MERELETRTASELIKGFENNIAEKFNTGDLMKGNLHITNVTTPILNYRMGPTSSRKFTLFEGTFYNP
jgi:hypothetical protein